MSPYANIGRPISSIRYRQCAPMPSTKSPNNSRTPIMIEVVSHLTSRLSQSCSGPLKLNNERPDLMSKELPHVAHPLPFSLEPRTLGCRLPIPPFRGHIVNRVYYGLKSFGFLPSTNLSISCCEAAFAPPAVPKALGVSGNLIVLLTLDFRPLYTTVTMVTSVSNDH
ncbi:520_t:CDS:2 [Dentiscutata heterogama]|uniref:520_t:CDS:1 n=1 Tax=Dentiscutata heterogama TaxID=1316150 RepID=A0ACA9MDK5_9GLOM|nr:520_t:CDS:2 [Dentiscutata heterogama]